MLKNLQKICTNIDQTKKYHYQDCQAQLVWPEQYYNNAWTDNVELIDMLVKYTL